MLRFADATPHECESSDGGSRNGHRAGLGNLLQEAADFTSTDR
ncbi:MAG: hypothetical protein SGI92_15265 [Bryobacteraceae bacterium]|nr:hypothetical protein [Bryobacteraceae bacterium]